jgi:hypothetical protein
MKINLSNHETGIGGDINSARIATNNDDTTP